MGAAYGIICDTTIGYIKKCLRKKDKCKLRLNLLIVGSTESDMVERIRAAQIKKPRTVLLQHDKRGKRSGWYRSGNKYKENCNVQKPNSSYQCDEYPMKKTTKGGKENYPRWVTLEWVPGRQNERIGGYFGYLVRQMNKQKNGKRRFLVITTYSIPSAAFAFGK